MFQGFEALKALAEKKTISKAAVQLGITQSAASKRIAQLEQELGQPLIEKRGRYVELTEYAQHLLGKALPLLSDFRHLLQEEIDETRSTITLAVTRSIAGTWGPKSFAHTAQLLPQIELQLRECSAPAAVEQVRSGECIGGLVCGTGESAADLVAEHLLDQTMVIVPSGLKPFPFPRRGTLPIISLIPLPEPQKILERRLKRAQKSWNISISITQRFETSPVIAQLAKAGFGHAVVPLAVAHTLGIKPKQLLYFPDPGIKVPISFICREQTRRRPLVAKFLEALKVSLPKRV